ncbi:response regulator [Flagellimonas sp. 389]|uniref:tetratricopeptide repeat-containing hybrid sensor histidine kinase/response regulator n=1 Tax=Flagellimonas sp. 389 TaxID=2835862 RepID=UPI001BD30808|nr:response regulator [Flagellimonas sp. 389]MBS9463943.1 response regulator [Flagellimonas sp. 389]
MKCLQFFTVAFLIAFGFALAQDKSLDQYLAEAPLFNEEELNQKLLGLRKDFYNANYENIIEEAPQLIQNAILINSPRIEQRLTSVLGNSFIQFDEHENAYDLFSKSLKRAAAKKDTFSIISTYINLGNTFIFKDPEKAIQYFKKGTYYIKPNKNGEDESGFNDIASFILYNNLAELYVGIKSPKQAQRYLKKSQQLLSLPSLASQENEYRAAGYYIQGAIDLLEKRNEDAISNAQKALSLGKDLLDENYLINIYEILIDVYANSEKYKELNTIRVPYDSLKNKRYEKEKIRQQQIASSKFNLENYKQELRETQLANELSEHKASKNKLLFIFSAILGGVLVLLLVVLLWARHKRNHLLVDLREKNQKYLEAKDKSEKLAQSNTRFLSTISHELRTPLYGIIGLSTVLMNNDELEKCHEEIKSLKFSADYLLALVNDVLHINKFESEEGRKLQNEDFSLYNLIQDIVQSFEFNNQKNNNSVHVDIDSQIPKMLFGDKMKLSQVLMNLISNASKFTQDGSISITAKLDKKDDDAVAVLFTIADTGLGIPLEEQDKIFDEFAQVENHKGQGGTGLGLPIVNKLLQILDSKLFFKSSKGDGTTFSFSLKVLESDMKSIPKTQEKINSKSLKNKYVLIVDDNKINQLVTQKVLALYNIRYAVAGDGLEAIEKAKNDTFDAILMDINMPGMDGFDASKAIRNFNTTIPIIALTANSNETMEETIYDFGIDDTVAKPYDTEILLKTLSKHIYPDEKYPFENTFPDNRNNFKLTV